MPYSIGITPILDDLRTAVINGAVTAGFVDRGAGPYGVGSRLLSLGATCFYELAIRDGRLWLRGASDAGFADASGWVSLCADDWFNIVYPATWRVFAFADEVYLVVQHQVNCCHWLAFGKSTIPLPASGCWVAASYLGQTGGEYETTLLWDGGSGTTYRQTSCRLFGGYGAANSFLHTEAGQWNLSNSITASRFPLALLDAQPSAYNQEAILIPVIAFAVTPSLMGPGVQLQHARNLRIDHYEFAQIITLGGDKWMVFPWYKKNTNPRSYESRATGTFGWAVRYEGP
ncbi:MAG: hypothetical protein LBR88_07335 [Zoogloeaceae bacterium]|jgi:hypothetical protein|nr:hypothetical protein [Zoogloeaceae bacterium]